MILSTFFAICCFPVQTYRTAKTPIEKIVTSKPISFGHGSDENVAESSTTAIEHTTKPFRPSAQLFGGIILLPSPVPVKSRKSGRLFEELEPTGSNLKTRKSQYKPQEELLYHNLAESRTNTLSYDVGHNIIIEEINLENQDETNQAVATNHHGISESITYGRPVVEYSYDDSPSNGNLQGVDKNAKQKQKEIHYHQHKHLHDHDHKQEHVHKHRQEHLHEHKHGHKHENKHVHNHQSLHDHQHKDDHYHSHIGHSYHEHHISHQHDHKQEQKHDHAHHEEHTHKQQNNHRHGRTHGHKHFGKRKHSHRSENRHSHNHKSSGHHHHDEHDRHNSHKHQGQHKISIKKYRH